MDARRIYRRTRRRLRGDGSLVLVTMGQRLSGSSRTLKEPEKDSSFSLNYLRSFPAEAGAVPF